MTCGRYITTGNKAEQPPGNKSSALSDCLMQPVPELLQLTACTDAVQVLLTAQGQCRVAEACNTRQHRGLALAVSQYNRSGQLESSQISRAKFSHHQAHDSTALLEADAGGSHLCNRGAAAMLVRAWVVGAVPNEELPSRHPSILGGELSTPPHIEQTHLATAYRHLHHSSRASCLVSCSPPACRTCSLFDVRHCCVKLNGDTVR